MEALNVEGGKSSTVHVGKVIDKIFNSVSECHFAKNQAPVCSPRNVVEKMKSFAKGRGAKIDGNAPPTKVVQVMKDLLNCNSESCVLKRKDFVDFAKINVEEIFSQFFKPEGPATHFGLLSNFNIDDVLDQMEERFKERKFLHIPFQMRDFEKVGTELANVDLADKFRSGYKTFGVVLNTDWSSGRGIHWFCIFGEHHGNKIVLEYFNSSGKEPLAEVQAWLQKTKHYLQKTLSLPVEIYYTTGIKFQDDDHSCGVYCVAFIWCRLEGIPPQWFKADNFNDMLMHKARKNLFRWEV